MPTVLIRRLSRIENEQYGQNQFVVLKLLTVFLVEIAYANPIYCKSYEVKMKLMINIMSWKFWLCICMLVTTYIFIFHFSIFSLKDVEILRVPSPDGRVDAVYIQRDAGAMTIAQHLVYIVPAKQQIGKKSNPVFQGKRVLNEKITWESVGKLLIQYRYADIVHFRNYTYPFPEDTSYEVRVSEKQTKEN